MSGRMRPSASKVRLTQKWIEGEFWSQQFATRSLIAFAHVKGGPTSSRIEMSDALLKKGVRFKMAKHGALRRGLEDSPWKLAAPCFVGNMGMALAEPEAEPATAAKAILKFCGQESDKPLLLLGGVYNRQLVTVMDIEALANLPPNEQVYAELAGAVSMDGLKMGLLRAMKSPTDGVAAVQHMEQPAQGLVSLLERWTEQRGGGDAEGQAS